LLRQESSTSDGLGEDLGVRFEFDRDEGDGSRNWARISRSPPRYSRSTSWNQRSQPPLFQATSSIQLPRSLSSISTSSHSEVKQGPTISRHSSSGTPGRLSSRSLYNGSSSSEILSSRSLYNASRRSTVQKEVKQDHMEVVEKDDLSDATKPSDVMNQGYRSWPHYTRQP